MPSTLLLDNSTWDLVVDASGNIAVAAEPYALAQDAASAIKTFSGEMYLDTGVGVPWLTTVFGMNPGISTLKQILAAPAAAVAGVAAAQVFVSAATERAVGGQVQVASAQGGQVAAANFSVANPQGVG